MKQFLFVALSTVALAQSVAAIDTPLFEQKFNDQGNVEFVNGAQLGVAGSGVSGKEADMAYTAPPANVGDELQPAGVVADPQLPGELEEVTVTAWYKIANPPVDATSLLNVGGIYLLWQGEQSGNWNMRLEMSLENRMRAWFNPHKAGSILGWNTEGQWIFYAMTWKRVGGEVVVYQGTAQDNIAEQRRWEGSEAVNAFNNALYPGVPAVIGNSYDAKTKKSGKRAFAGDIDNVRIFGSALSSEDIDKVRMADAANDPL